MDLNELLETLKDEPAYRIKQIKKSLFFDSIENWREATNLPLLLRNKLENEFSLKIEGEIFVSKDNDATRALITLKDGLKTESVLMKHKDGRNTVCVSCQVGCKMGCLFCATGQMGFKRDLNSEEITDQILFFNRLLKKDNQKVTNVVFMGMGEPFLNYKEVIESIRSLKDDFGIGARKISISTIGIPEGIANLTKDEPQVNLAVSLHAPNDELRTKVMPAGKEYTLVKIFKAVDEYIEKTKRKVMFEYLIIDGFNDSEEQAKELSKLMKKPLYHVNLISCNPVGEFRAPSNFKVNRFKEILENQGVSVTIRYRFGRNVKGACGQLAGKQS
jgi:23S rRNA (adenine2503-C2)-methyltransferase